MLALFPLQGLMAQSNVIDRVEWVVGDKSILRSDIEEAIRFWVASGRTFEGDPYCVAGEDLAVQQLFLHQAALDSIEVDEGNIMRQVEMQMEYVIQQIGSKEKMEEYFNMTSSDIREMYREQLYNKEMADRMKMSIVGDLKISPALVRRYMESLPQDSIPFIQQQVEVQVITLNPIIDIEEIERVKAELRDYTERVHSGEAQFSTLAVFYSQDTESARRGGELNAFGRGEMVPEFSAVAFNLTEPGRVSKIVETEFGYHIIQLIEKRGDRVRARHILRKPEVPAESMNASLMRLDSIANDIRNGKISFNDAVLFSADKNTRKNFGLMSNEMTLSSRFELQELPQEVAKVVYEMNVGEVSAPFVMIDQKTGKEICAIVKLKTRIEGHKATPTEDFQIIKDVMVAKMKQQKLENWIKEKQKSTYVRINEKWCDCEFQYPGWVRK